MKTLLVLVFLITNHVHASDSFDLGSFSDSASKVSDPMSFNPAQKKLTPIGSKKSVSAFGALGSLIYLLGPAFKKIK